MSDETDRPNIQVIGRLFQKLGYYADTETPFTRYNWLCRCHCHKQHITTATYPVHPATRIFSSVP